MVLDSISSVKSVSRVSSEENESAILLSKFRNFSFCVDLISTSCSYSLLSKVSFLRAS